MSYDTLIADAQALYESSDDLLGAVVTEVERLSFSEKKTLVEEVFYAKEKLEKIQSILQ